MPVLMISIADMRDRLSAGPPPLLIDVRSPAEFSTVHAKGATLMPLDSLDPVAVTAKRAATGGTVYLLCHSGGRARKAADALIAAGVDDVAVVEGGTQAWQKAGLPVESNGGRTMSIERQVRIGAGSLVAIGIALGWLLHRAFLGLSLFVGLGLVFAGVTDFCGMGLLLARMPWNRRAG